MSKQKNKAHLSEYENLQKNVRTLVMPAIEVWQNMYADKDYWIEMEVPEFTCICPKTGLPDFAVIRIRYRPDKYCLELKSFKYYMNAYRDIGIFHEHAVNKILEDFVHACKPRQATISGDFNSRGGIQTSVTAEYIRK
ncbi:MAG: preQ(1) synthase [Candidatus Omnitrophica bacterium]|nr:preQ(1) synthase [Candidatus Omnitrophota bacterium]